MPYNHITACIVIRLSQPENAHSKISITVNHAPTDSPRGVDFINSTIYLGNIFLKKLLLLVNDILSHLLESCSNVHLDKRFYELPQTEGKPARLSGGYVPFSPYYSSFMCPSMWKVKQKYYVMCLLESECTKRLKAHSQGIPADMDQIFAA